MQSDSHSVLLLSHDSKLISQIQAFLILPLFELTVTGDYNDARRISSERNYNIIIVDSGDGDGIDFATSLSDSYATVLLLVTAEHFDEISYRVEAYGILTFTRVFEPFYFYNMMKVAIAVHYKVQTLSSQTIKLKTKMEEIHLINRAKLLLVEKAGMSEEEAHRYLEREAMDKGIKKTAVAEKVIGKYK